MTPVTQYYPLYAPDRPVCQGIRERIQPPYNPRGEVMWARVKAYLTANPTRTVAVQTPTGTFVVTFRPATVEGETLAWVENSYLRDAELHPARNVYRNPVVFP